MSNPVRDTVSSPGHNSISNDLQFEQLIAGFTLSEQFLARQIREVQVECKRREHCYPSALFTRRQLAAGAGMVGGSSALVVALIEILQRLAG